MSLRFKESCGINSKEGLLGTSSTTGECGRFRRGVSMIRLVTRDGNRVTESPLKGREYFEAAILYEE
jgi:hypothetical protein